MFATTNNNSSRERKLLKGAEANTTGISSGRSDYWSKMSALPRGYRGKETDQNSDFSASTNLASGYAVLAAAGGVVSGGVVSVLASFSSSVNASQLGIVSGAITFAAVATWGLADYLYSRKSK